MGRGTRTVIAAVALAAVLGYGFHGRAGSISVADDAGKQLYLGGLDALISFYRAESAAALKNLDGVATSRSMWYDPGVDSNQLFGGPGMTGADADWARSNLRIYDLYRQLGGNVVMLKQLFRSKGENFYVSLDSVGGQWFKSSQDAHGFLLKLLVKRSAELPKAVKDAVADLGGNDLEGVVLAARDAMAQDRAFVKKGTTVTATLTSDNFADLGSAPVVKAPSGAVVTQVTVDSATQLTVTIALTPAVALGAGSLHVFKANTSMVPADSFGLYVVENNGAPSLPADDHAATTATATVLGGSASATGRINADTDEDLFSITIAGPGTLTLSSTGGTDLVGALEDAGGVALSSDDDGGDWYNFKIARAVTAGTYYLRVRHCCKGAGTYTVTSSFVAD